MIQFKLIKTKILCIDDTTCGGFASQIWQVNENQSTLCSVFSFRIKVFYLFTAKTCVISKPNNANNYSLISTPLSLSSLVSRVLTLDVNYKTVLRFYLCTATLMYWHVFIYIHAQMLSYAKLLPNLEMFGKKINCHKYFQIRNKWSILWSILTLNKNLS